MSTKGKRELQTYSRLAGLKSNEIGEACMAHILGGCVSEWGCLLDRWRNAEVATLRAHAKL